MTKYKLILSGKYQVTKVDGKLNYDNYLHAWEKENLVVSLKIV